jgi:tRNA 2-thiocytidine biosynthesis protein TtcA
VVPTDGAKGPWVAAVPGYLRALRFLDRTTSRAIRDFALLEDGDRVLVAVSGGKDSMVLLETLARRRAWRAERYDLVACHVDDGVCLGCGFRERLAEVCAGLQVSLRIVQERTLPGADEVAGGVSPCFVCAWRRRKALFTAAEEERCGLVAFGHHRDDVAETLLLNLLWHGRHETMEPRRPMFDGRVTIIRPFALVEERDIARVARLGSLPVHACACPHSRDSKREVAAELIRSARSAGCRGATANLARSALRPAPARAGGCRPLGDT